MAEVALVGAAVEANYGGEGEWFPGKITKVRGDGTYDILYNDGDKEPGQRGDGGDSNAAAGA